MQLLWNMGVHELLLLEMTKNYISTWLCHIQKNTSDVCSFEIETDKNFSSPDGMF